MRLRKVMRKREPRPNSSRTRACARTGPRDAERTRTRAQLGWHLFRSEKGSNPAPERLWVDAEANGSPSVEPPTSGPGKGEPRGHRGTWVATPLLRCLQVLTWTQLHQVEAGI